MTKVAVLFALCILELSIGFESHKNTYENIIIRDKRQVLLYPNSTILQFNAGLATHTPVTNATVLVNWAFQANFQLPWNTTQIPTDVFLAGTRYNGDSREIKQNYDNNHDTSSEKTKNDDRDSILKYMNQQRQEEVTGIRNDVYSYNRFERKKREVSKSVEARYDDEVGLQHVYKHVEDLLSGFGHNGSACVLRTICQLNAEPLHDGVDDDGDIITELLNILLDPLKDEEMLSIEESQPYLNAQILGKEQADCKIYFPSCDASFVDLFTKVTP